MLSGHEDELHAVVASFPRSGRTWVTGMVADVIRRSEGLPPGTLFLNEWTRQNIADFRERFAGFELPLRLATHDSLRQTPQHQYLLMIARDPLDCMSSYFHYATKRESQEFQSVRSFLDSEWHGVARLARWWNSWAAAMDESVLITYEQIRREPVDVLSRALSALGVEHDEDLEKVVDRADFSKRQAAERNRSENTDPDALFVRRGEVGSGRDELGVEDIEFIGQRLHELLEQNPRNYMSQLGYL